MEEVDKGTKPIESVGTAVAAFIGYTERAVDSKTGKSLLGKPTLVTNWSQYVAQFGAFVDGAYTPDSVYGYFNNGGSICYIVSVKTLGAASDPDSAEAAQTVISSEGEKGTKLLQFTAREGGPVGNNIKIELKPDAPAEGDGKKASGEFTLQIKIDNQVVESFSGLTTGKGDKNVATVLETQSKLVLVEVVGKADLAPAAGTYALAGGKLKEKQITLKDYQGSVAERSGLGGLEPLTDVTMIVAPDLMSSYQAGEIDMKGVQAVQQALIDYCELVRYCFAILDCPPNMMPQQMKEWRNTVNYDSTRAALYYPWIEIADMTGKNGRTRLVPPSGHMAGC